MDKMINSAPWVLYYRRLKALFEGDNDIEVIFCEEKPEVKLFVFSQDKMKALKEFLPEQVAFGNIILKVTVAIGEEDESKLDLIEDLFRGNNNVDAINEFGYVVFSPNIAQYYADNLSDPRGYKSELYEDIAREVFINTEGLSFCTAEFYEED